MEGKNSCDNFASEYKSSRQLHFRSYTRMVFPYQILGPMEGLSILDLACRDGIQTRRLMESGAEKVLGVDLSAEMISLALEEEVLDPLGCEQEVGDASNPGSAGEFEIVNEAHLLNYANPAKLLSQFAKTICSNLKPGGRFLGINNNPAKAAAAYPALLKI